ncbi:MAG TPA: hypothetical protein VMM56_06370 [Planctomycetaceae bacterium]|nr:hypothetical protein [Planctomycetaceae bacterium]
MSSINPLCIGMFLPAGMPSVNLTSFAANRLELISLFMVGLLASAFVVQGVWNGLLAEFPKLPRLSYRRACAIVFLWGLLFVIVLTMISGARELMTPGAWIKKGNTYELQAGMTPVPAVVSNEDLEVLRERRERMTVIYKLIGNLQKQWNFVPKQRAESDIPEELWKIPHAHGLEYIYLPELEIEEYHGALLVEPEFFEDGRLVLRKNGEIDLIQEGIEAPSR